MLKLPVVDPDLDQAKGERGAGLVLLCPAGFSSFFYPNKGEGQVPWVPPLNLSLVTHCILNLISSINL